jgi:SAM-dependent methyltransferase
MKPASIQDERGFNQGYAPVGSAVERMRRRNHWFLDQIGLRGATRVLELGCSIGDTAAYIAGHTDAEVVAVDISRKFVDIARERHQAPNLRFERYDLLAAGEAPFGTFDLVIGNGILHHLVEGLPPILRALRSITRPGGGMAFIEPNLLNPYCLWIFGTGVGRRWAKLEPDEMAFTRGSLMRQVGAAGWSDVKVRTRDFLIPGLPEWTVKPILAAEPALEAAAMTRWLAQSHFLTAEANAAGNQ